MKTARISRKGKAHLAIWLSVGTLVPTVLNSTATDLAPIVRSSTNHLQVPQRNTAVQLSPALAEILRMVRVRLDPAVVEAYIRSSKFAYNPTAEEIVTLKRLGVSEAVIIAMLERSAELRSGQVVQPQRNPAARPAYASPAAYSNPSSPYPTPLLPRPNPRPIFYHNVGAFLGGQVVSFNNSFPTLINDQPVYAGYYIPRYVW